MSVSNTRGKLPSLSPHLPILLVDPCSGYRAEESYQCPHRNQHDLKFQDVAVFAKRGCPVCIMYYEASIQCGLSTPCIENCAQGTASDQTCEFLGFSYYSKLGLEWANNPIEFFLDSRDADFMAALNDMPSSLCDPRIFVPCQFYGEQVTLDHYNRKPPGDTSSKASLKNANDWLRECDVHHDCRQGQPRALPRRILDVSNSRVFLRESDGQLNGDYACLSHCWGKKGESKVLRTTKNKLEAFIGNIPWDDLPKTFRDAITFVRGLGLQWLWIDSLCIVQNDRLDWQQESGKMATIYQNAYVTLAATDSADSERGCFSRQDSKSSSAKPTPAYIQFPNGTKSQLFCRLPLRHKNRDFPLIKRAWAYQERLLSPRVIHFAGYELIWECRKSSQRECGYGSLDTDFPRAYIPGEPSERSTNSIDSQWRSLVQEYSRLELTYPNDVFPALSGLANRFISETGDQYVAGMWKSTILQDLIWRRQGAPKRPTRIFGRAPSWSWASSTVAGTRHSVRFEKIDHPLAELVDVKCTPSGADPTGAVRDGVLTLRARAIITAVEFVKEKEGDTPWYIIRIAKATYRRPSYEMGLSNGDLRVMEGKQEGPIRSIPNVHLIMIGKSVRKGTAISWVNSDISVKMPSQEHRFCLALIESGESGTFERLGVIELKEYQGYPSSPVDEDGTALTYEDMGRAFEVRKEINRDVFRTFDEADLRTFIIV